MAAASAADLAARWSARARQLRPFAEAASHVWDLAAEELRQAVDGASVCRTAPCNGCAAETALGGIAALDARGGYTAFARERLVCPACGLAPAIVLGDHRSERVG